MKLRCDLTNQTQRSLWSQNSQYKSKCGRNICRKLDTKAEQKNNCVKRTIQNGPVREQTKRIDSVWLKVGVYKSIVPPGL